MQRNFKVLILALLIPLATPIRTTAQSPGTVAIVDLEKFKPLLSKADDTLRIINFWATWCVPCVKEIPYFEQINNEYINKNVKVVLVSLDFADHLATRVIPFVEKHGMKSEVILLDEPDGNKWIDLVSEEWSGAIPATLFTMGKNTKFEEGMLDYQELSKIVESMLKY